MTGTTYCSCRPAVAHEFDYIENKLGEDVGVVTKRNEVMLDETRKRYIFILSIYSVIHFQLISPFIKNPKVYK